MAPAKNKWLNARGATTGPCPMGAAMSSSSYHNMSVAMSDISSAPPSREELGALLHKYCSIPAARDFQITHGLDLVLRKDLFLVVAPGMGKTVVMAAPFLVAKERKEQGIALVVVPSKILTEQQVRSQMRYCPLQLI